MKKLIVLALIFLAGCSASGGSYAPNPDALGTQGARAVTDSEATRQSATRIAAMATVQAQQEAAAATAVAMQIINATAQSQWSTREQLDIELLEVGVQATATKAAAVNQADATATAIFLHNLERDLSLQASIAESEAAALSTARANENERIKIKNDIGEFWREALPYLVIILSLIVTIPTLIYAGVVIYGRWLEKSAPVFRVQMSDPGDNMFYRKDGHIVPFNPARTLAAPAPALIEAPALGLNTSPAKWESLLAWDVMGKVPLGASVAFMGERRAGVLWDRAVVPHLMVAGGTGSGKTASLLVPASLAVWGQSAHIIIINAQGSDFSEMRGYPNVTFFPALLEVELVEPLTAFLDYIDQEGNRRDQVISRYNVSKWSELPPGADGAGEIIIVIDEFLSILDETALFMDRLRQNPSLAPAERKAEELRLRYVTSLLWSKLYAVFSKRRKHGIHVMLSVTDPTEGALGKTGMRLRRQSGKIACRMDGDTSFKFLNLGRNSQWPNGSAGMDTGQFIAHLHGQPLHAAAFYPTPSDMDYFLRERLPDIRPFSLPHAMAEGINEPRLLTVGTPPPNGESDPDTGVWEPIWSSRVSEQRLRENAEILRRTAVNYKSKTAAANIIFRERGEISPTVAANTEMIEEAAATLQYMAEELKDVRAAEILKLPS